jgi:predicted Ser/Thr protein kinase
VKRIGPYEVVRELGRGGMGAVYEVRHPQIPRSLALKLSDAGDEDLQRRFEREGQLLASLSHPNVLQVHQQGRAPEGMYLVTELVAGESLGQRLRRGPLGEEESRALLVAVAGAVAALHAQGILHRDLKPDNVLIRADGSPVLIDFGLARSDSTDRLTLSNELLGTPAYMAPEQIEAASSVDERADVYALGGLLFAALTGAPPFQGPTAISILDAVLNQPISWPAEGQVSSSLRAVCEGALAKEPAQRPHSALAFAAGLEARAAGPRGRGGLWALLSLIALVASVLLWGLRPGPDEAPGAAGRPEFDTAALVAVREGEGELARLTALRTKAAEAGAEGAARELGYWIGVLRLTREELSSQEITDLRPRSRDHDPGAETLRAVLAATRGLRRKRGSVDERARDLLLGCAKSSSRIEPRLWLALVEFRGRPADGAVDPSAARDYDRILAQVSGSIRSVFRALQVEAIFHDGVVRAALIGGAGGLSARERGEDLLAACERDLASTLPFLSEAAEAKIPADHRKRVWQFLADELERFARPDQQPSLQTLLLLIPAFRAVQPTESLPHQLLVLGIQERDPELSLVVAEACPDGLSQQLLGVESARVEVERTIPRRRARVLACMRRAIRLASQSESNDIALEMRGNLVKTLARGLDSLTLEEATKVGGEIVREARLLIGAVTSDRGLRDRLNLALYMGLEVAYCLGRGDLQALADGAIPPSGQGWRLEFIRAYLSRSKPLLAMAHLEQGLKGWLAWLKIKANEEENAAKRHKAPFKAHVLRSLALEEALWFLRHSPQLWGRLRYVLEWVLAKDALLAQDPRWHLRRAWLRVSSGANAEAALARAARLLPAESPDLARARELERTTRALRWAAAHVHPGWALRLPSLERLLAAIPPLRQRR